MKEYEGRNNGYGSDVEDEAAGVEVLFMGHEGPTLHRDEIRDWTMHDIYHMSEGNDDGQAIKKDDVHLYVKELVFI